MGDVGGTGTSRGWAHAPFPSLPCGHHPPLRNQLSGDLLMRVSCVLISLRMTSPQRTCLGTDTKAVPGGGVLGLTPWRGGTMCGRGFLLLQDSACGQPYCLWVRQSLLKLMGR